MPRSVTGVYSLPLPPVVPGELIEADWANPTLDDVGLALTDSLDRNGRGGMLAPFKFFDGTVSAPGAAFANAPSTGFWRDTSALHTSWVGAEIMSVDGNGVTLQPTKEVFVPTAPGTVNSLTNKAYVDASIASAIATGDFLPRAGGIMTGLITFQDTGEGVKFSSNSQVYDSGVTMVYNAGSTITSMRWYFNSVEKLSLTSAGVMVVAGALSAASLASNAAISAVTSISAGSTITAATSVTAPNVYANGGYFRVNTSGTGLYSDAYGFGVTITSDRVTTGGSYLQCPNLLCTGTVYSLYSDDRLKDRIQIINTGVLDKLNRLDAFTYRRNALAQQYGFEDDGDHLGLSAQQVQREFPEVVALAPFDVAEGGGSASGENYLTIDYSRLVPILVAAINQLRYEVRQIVPIPLPVPEAEIPPPPPLPDFPETPIS